MGRDTVQLETTVNTISHEYLLDFISEYGIPEALHPELPGSRDRIFDFSEGKQKAGEEYSPMLHQATGFSQKLEQSLLLGRRESVSDRRGLAHVLHRGREDTGYAPYPHPKTTRDVTVRSRDKSQILSGGRDMDLFNLIRAPNPTKVKVGSRPRASHEVPLLTLTANRVIEMDDPTVATDSSGVPSTIERSPLDFALEVGASDQGTAAPEMPPSEDVPGTVAPRTGQAEEVAAVDPLAAAESRKKGRDGIDVNAPPKSSQGVAAAGDPESENASSPVEVGSPESVYWPEWCVTNGNLLDTPEACQDLVDHVAMGSQLRLRFEQEAKLLRKSVAQVASRDRRIQARELEIKNLEALLEAEASTKKAAEDMSAGLSQELENMRAQFSDLQAFADAVSAGIGKGLSEGLRHGLEHGQAQRSLESIEAYDPEAKAKFVAALQALKDLKYPLVDQLESLKDASMDVIMAALYLESDTGDDASQDIRDLCPSSSQLTIPIYQRSDGVPVSAPRWSPRVLLFCWRTRPRRLSLTTLR
nr:hypothetical protein [Tanacetum cinerariifolium]